MSCIHPQTARPLADKYRDPLFFPVRIRRCISAPVAVLAVVLLLSPIGRSVGYAQDRSFVAEQSARESAGGPFASYVTEAARRFDVPAHWIDAVMAQESGGDVRAVSSQGAMGLMQIMPETWEYLRSQYALGDDPFDAHDNILAGTAYLRELHDRYGSPGFLAAYNAGPIRYEEYLMTARELPVETQLYVAALAHLMGAPQADGRVAIVRRETPWQESALFAAHDSPAISIPLWPLASSDRHSVGPSVDRPFALKPRSDDLFVNRSSASSRQ